MSAWFPPLALEVAALIAAVSAMVPLEVFALGLESFYGGPQAVLRLYGDRDLGQRAWHPSEVESVGQSLSRLSCHHPLVLYRVGFQLGTL